LPAGDYQLEVSTQSETVSQKVILAPRDRAILSVFLRKELAGTVVAANIVIKVFDAEFGDNRGALGKAVGGGFGRADDNAFARRKDEPAPVMAAALQVEAANMVVDQKSTATLAKDKQESGSSGAHVRSYFPEALYINPEIIKIGRAHV